ncbi:EAL domain-containing protein [Kibdelosporangium persicum]|uniref:Cyclic di-GMP phosphodiesterase Gmr n=1 Tax=Kibdelosporangium persicum TaxID=2698649 RepID=A0ABX2F1I1_9PSEU|nr:EAL domain-containing protein [Kibdelosporangium persicum]NRN64850.1 Cyclic di-GMP phosphodiesterase Gmr [Kibdelosporangium persicum]
MAELVEPAGSARGSALSDSSPAEAGWVRCSDGLVVQANLGAAVLAGVHAPDELVGQSLAGLLAEDESGQRVLRPDGTSVEVTALRLEQDAGQVTVVFGPPVNGGRFGAEELIEVQRISGLGSFVHVVAERRTYYSEPLHELLDVNLGADDTEAELLFRTHPEDLPAVIEFRERLLECTDSEPIELELRERDTDRVFLVRAQPVFDDAGEVCRVRGIVQEISKLRAPDRQRGLDRRLFEDAQRVALLGTWAWNTATGDCVWSTMLYELFGVEPRSAMTYDDYLEFVHPDDRSWVDRTWRRLADSGEAVVCEYRVVRPDSQVRVLRCRGASFAGRKDGPVMVGTAQDVTEQRSTESRMQRSSQRFTDLVAITPVGIGLFDAGERLVDANDALCKLLGMGLERLRGLTVEKLTHPDHDPRARLAAGQRVMVTAAGDPVYCELNVVSSVADDGRRFWLVVFQDVTERRRAAELLRHQATHDDLTGLPGRAAVNELLAGLLSGPGAKDVALLFCDVDNFKRVNDSLGHDAGDELLVALARRLEDGLPEGCTAARMSGDEYVVICRDQNKAGGVDELATKVAHLFRTAVPVRGQLLRVSASVGAAVPSGPDTTGADLLRFADAAMFEAKRRGAGRVSLANAALMASADSQMYLEGQLREALGNDGLVLYYQPVVGVDGTILTAEALVRWPHPDRGLLTPGQFLPVAEQGDLLRDLDRWVLRTALREAKTWPETAGRQVSVAINLAGLVPGDPEFVDVVATAIAGSGVEWERVVLELVETSFVDLPSRSRSAMADLVSRGVRFAVDDFGTGYSSLARLKELPAQIIKVDRRFVAGIGTDPSDFAVARAVVDLARAMGRTCVAEGVETAPQFSMLRDIGVEAYQGWLLSRAVPADEFRALLELGPLHVPPT